MESFQILCCVVLAAVTITITSFLFRKVRLALVPSPSYRKITAMTASRRHLLAMLASHLISLIAMSIRSCEDNKERIRTLARSYRYNISTVVCDDCFAGKMSI
jgi:hypothetical protein